MLRRSLVRLAQESRQPRIKFPDRKAAHGAYAEACTVHTVHAAELADLVRPSFPVTDESHTPHPHPAAPQDVAQNFDHFQEVLQSGPHFHPEKIQQTSQASSSSNAGAEAGKKAESGGAAEVAEDLHDLPKRFWQTPALALEEKEMDAIMVGLSVLLQRVPSKTDSCLNSIQSGGATLVQGS